MCFVTFFCSPGFTLLSDLIRARDLENAQLRALLDKKRTSLYVIDVYRFSVIFSRDKTQRLEVADFEDLAGRPTLMVETLSL